MFLVILIKECRQSLLISDAHSLEFPLPVAFVQATELHGSLYAEILFQFIFSNLLVSVGVIDADERVAHLTEILSALISFVDCHHEADLSGTRIDLAQVDVYAFVVAFPFAGKVVAGVFHSFIRRFQIVVEYEILIGKNLLILTKNEADASRSKSEPVSELLVSHPSPIVNFGRSMVTLCPFSKLIMILNIGFVLCCKFK